MKATLQASCATDLDVVNAARVSFGGRREAMELADEKLIGYLLRNRHGTPFEHGYFRFHVEAPIFVLREWQRHRCGSFNEMSARYVEMEDHFYQPEEFRVQVGKPGSYTYEPASAETGDRASGILEGAYRGSWVAYKRLLYNGVAKEQARAVLPVGIYSQMIWSCNPRWLMHFLSLRNATDAQEEIRGLAAEVEEEFAAAMPVTHRAFVDGGRLAP